MFKVTDEYIKITRGDTGTVDIHPYIGSTPTEFPEDSVVKLSVKKNINDTYLSMPQKIARQNGSFRSVDFFTEDTQNLPFGVYWFDIVVEYKNGDIDTATSLNSGGKPLPFVILEETHSYEGDN